MTTRAIVLVAVAVGAAGGMVFEHPLSWDVRDRFEKVAEIASSASPGRAGDHLSGVGGASSARRAAMIGRSMPDKSVRQSVANRFDTFPEWRISTTAAYRPGAAADFTGLPCAS